MRKILITLIIIFVSIQLIMVDHDNPPIQQRDEIVFTNDVKIIIENSCFDCHSNKTIWPWYSYIAPASWFVANHVHEARNELNFSEWNSYSEKRKKHKLKEIVEEVDEGEMPLTSYVILHQNSGLTEDQKKVLIEWAISFKKTVTDTTLQ